MKTALLAIMFAVASFGAYAQAHNYVLRDGMEYGYPRALTDEERKAGQLSEQIFTFMYLGSRDGKHQVLSRNGNSVDVLECEIPCRYVKGMSFVDMDYLRDNITVERFVAGPGSIISAVMDDIEAGQLAIAGTVRNGKPHTMWMDATKGLLFFPKGKK